MHHDAFAEQTDHDPRFKGYFRLPIELGPLILRRPFPEDHNDFLETYAAPEVHEFDFSEPWTPENVAWMLQEQSTIRIGDKGVGLRLAVVLRSEWKVIGDCVLTIEDVENRIAEIGVAVNRKYWDRRCGALATHAAIGFGFGRLGMHRIVAATDPRNDRCTRMLERVGMRREAHFRSWRKMKGNWSDDYIYAMLDDEWDSALANSIIAEMPQD